MKCLYTKMYVYIQLFKNLTVYIQIFEYSKLPRYLFLEKDFMQHVWLSWIVNKQMCLGKLHFFKKWKKVLFQCL